MNRLLLALCLLASLSASQLLGAERRLVVEPAARQTPRYQKIEFTLSADISAANPYDDREVDLQLELTTPAGKTLRTPAFFFQPFERKSVQRGEWLYPTGKPVWKARFAPSEVGQYRAVAVLKDRAGSLRSDPVSFESTPSDRPGFLRVSRRNPRYLEFDSGNPFFAVGQNVAFVTDSYRTIEKLQKLGANGANFARIWACSEDWALAVEARKSAWGRSWDWRPPAAALPDREGYHDPRFCLRLSTDSSPSLSANPTRPVALRPGARYQLTGEARASDRADLSVDLHGAHTVSLERRWTKFRLEFSTAADQMWLNGPTFRAPPKATVWLRDLSLTEAGGGPELLAEADINRPTFGVYNQPDCFMLDQILDAAEQSGVYLQLVLLTRDHYMHLLSRDNTAGYDRAIAAARQLMRYAAARWGYSPNVAAWEYFNEMNPNLPTERFYTELARAFDAFDVNRHLRTNSTWSSPARDDHHPDLDTADLHYYLRPVTGPLWKDEVESVLTRYAVMRDSAPNRPIFFAEYGMTDNQWQRAREIDKDTRFTHLHNALWTSALCGFASTVCHWYWDDIHRKDVYHLYKPISRFTADIPWTAGPLRPISASAPAGLRLVGLQGDTFAAVWVADRKSTWWNHATGEAAPQPQANIAIRLENLPARPCTVQWWDTHAGKILRTEQLTPEKGALTLRPPTFTDDLACKILFPQPR